MLVYLVNAAKRYDAIFQGTDPEAFAFDETGGLTETIRESTLALAGQIKAMQLLAEETGILPEAEELEKCAACAAAYYATLTEADLIALDHVSQETIRAMYEEILVATRVYEYAVRDVNPEISDDEARTITVEVLRIGKRDNPASALALAQEAQKMLEDGEDFAAVQPLYNESETERLTFGTGETEDFPEEEAFSLETGEVSGILETESSYYILRCVSAFDRQATRANKERIVRMRRNEAFGELYDAFVEGLPVQLNTGAWEALEIPDGEDLTSGFWDTYELFFGEDS